MTPLVFASSRYQYLAERVAACSGWPLGEVERYRFPDGEKYQRVLTPVADRDVVIVGGTLDEDATCEIYDLASTIVAAGAYRLTRVVPYYGYSTMERSVRPGEVVTAKTRARLFSSIPPASYGNRVLLLDLHSEGIPHYFEGEITAFHVYAKELVKEAARRLAGDGFVMACTDAGRAKWVESLANELGTEVAFVFKRRVSGSQTEVTASSARVAGRDVVIYDDMIRTGGSLIEAGRAYRAAGAARLWAITTHGLFPGNALDKLRASGLFEKIVCTDSHPRARKLAGEFLEVLDVSSMFARHLWGTLPGG
ncbi:MAG: ribose-phosphate pyrophosphokinase [Sandaracinaceae bacterium]|nr:ribose-phosphate pyrophosphokinase [Sandaracinaceae bacterium]